MNTMFEVIKKAPKMIWFWGRNFEVSEEKVLLQSLNCFVFRSKMKIEFEQVVINNISSFAEKHIPLVFSLNSGTFSKNFDFFFWENSISFFFKLKIILPLMISNWKFWFHYFWCHWLPTIEKKHKFWWLCGFDFRLHYFRIRVKWWIQVAENLF